MSIYRCGICEQYKDADMSGCYENPFCEFTCICEECDMSDLVIEKKEELCQI